MQLIQLHSLTLTHRKGATRPLAGIEEAVAEMLAKLVPVSLEKERAHTYELSIKPKMIDAGFSLRHCKDNGIAGSDERAKNQRNVAHRANNLLQRAGAIVALVGPRGTGKTTIAAQICQKRLWSAHEAYFRTGRAFLWEIIYEKTSAIISKLKAMYADFGTIEMERMERRLACLVKADLLILDELHEVPEDSKHKDRIITDIIDRRYAAKRDTLLISNQKRSEFISTINPSIISRLNEHGGIIPCEWESFREKPAI